MFVFGDCSPFFRGTAHCVLSVAGPSIACFYILLYHFIVCVWEREGWEFKKMPTWSSLNGVIGDCCRLRLSTRITRLRHDLIHVRSCSLMFTFASTYSIVAVMLGLYPRDAVLVQVLAMGLCLSVCLSVTRRYCIESAARIELFVFGIENFPQCV